MHLVALVMFLAAAVVAVVPPTRNWPVFLVALGLAAWVWTAVPISVG